VGKRFNQPEWLASERELMERARGGSRDAMAELYAAFAPSLYAEVLMPRVGGDVAAAEDALAETFREVFARLGDWRDEGKSLWSFAARVAMTKAIDLHRARSREGRALTNYARLVAPILPAPEDPGEAMAREADGARIRERVAEVLGRIHERYRRAIELRFFEERSREACAEALGVSVSTFDVVLLRAVRAFRKEWEGE
jgi:RNA polymerase sigma-70 factor (ECF subfamily)